MLGHMFLLMTHRSCKLSQREDSSPALQVKSQGRMALHEGPDEVATQTVVIIRICFNFAASLEIDA